MTNVPPPAGWPNTLSYNFKAGNWTEAWWYQSTAVFARPYAQLSPGEDHATTWETYFMDIYHGTLIGNTKVQAKHDNLDLFFRDLKWGGIFA